MTGTVTNHLLQLSTATILSDPTIPYTDAIIHPFLQAAGAGTMDKSAFALWLSQDRIYAVYAYPRFIGSLIASIPFTKTVTSVSETHKRQILKTLTGALQNIIKEEEFFDRMADTYELDLGIWKERKGTRDYIAEMDSVAGSKNIEDGLVFLWAMEKVYLDAWTLVRNEMQKRQTPQQASSTDVLVAQFVENWTSPEFVKFVDELADLVNATGVRPERATEIWERVIELEKGFWPTEGEGIHMRKDT
ncbi:heme oxygenase-like protein [Mycena polygramma]|nr:heme oxygenase-like protein [Mycena polygramma]